MARELFIAPAIGDLRARQVGVLIGSAHRARRGLAHGALAECANPAPAVRDRRVVGRADADVRNPARPCHRRQLGTHPLGLQSGARRVHAGGARFMFFAPWFTARLRGIDSGALITKPGMITHHGGCHCGRVRFEVDAPAELLVDECNCSMCSRFGYQHLIVPADRFRLLKGQRRADHLHLQHRHGETSFLRDLRRQVVLRAALAPGRLQRQCALHRFAHHHRHEDQPRRRSKLGAALPGGTRRVHRLNADGKVCRQHSTLRERRARSRGARPGARFSPSGTGPHPRPGIDARTRARALAHADLGAGGSAMHGNSSASCSGSPGPPA